MEIDVRKTNDNDFQDICILNESLKKNSQNQSAKSDYWNDDSIENSMKNDFGLVAIENSKKIIAFLFWKVLDEQTFEIQKLGTSQQFQGKGVMSLLFSGFISALPKPSKVWLETHETNVKARKLYEKLGCKIVGNRKKYFSDGGSAILYSLHL